MGLTGIPGRSRGDASDDRGLHGTDRVMGSWNKEERAHWQDRIDERVPSDSRMPPT